MKENAGLVCQKIFKYNLLIDKNDYCRLISLGEMEMGGRKRRTEDSLKLSLSESVLQ